MAGQGIRAGQAFIELYATDNLLVNTLRGAQSKLKQFDAAVSSIGKNLLKFGAILSTPFVAGTKTFGDLEQSLASLKTKVSPDDFEKLKQSINGIGERTGNNTNEIVETFTDLAAKGYTAANGIDKVAESILKFAKVSGIEAKQSVQLVTDAVTSFKDSGLTADRTMALLSATATAGRTSIANVADAFSSARSEFATGGQTADELAQAIGILANAGIHGAEAGGELSKFLSTIQEPGSKAKKVIEGLGIAVDSASGGALPFSQVIGNLADKINGLNKGDASDALRKIFGGSGVAAGKILLEGGSKAFQDIAAKMNAATPIAQKYNTIIDTLYGTLNKIKAVAEQVSNAIGEAVAGPIGTAANAILIIVKALRNWATQNSTLILTFGAIAAGVLATGAAFTIVGFLISAAGSVATGALSLYTIATSAAAIATAAFLSELLPIVAVSVVVGAALAGIGFYILKSTGALDIFKDAFAEVKQTAIDTFKGISDALKSGDFSLAAQILGSGLKVVFFETADAIQHAFFKMFNSISIDGVGLGTALAESALAVQLVWIRVTSAISQAFNKLKQLSEYETTATARFRALEEADRLRDKAKNAPNKNTREVFEDLANKKDKEVSVLQDKMDGGLDKGKAELDEMENAARARMADVIANMSKVAKDGENADPFGIKESAIEAKKLHETLLKQAAEESSAAGPGFDVNSGVTQASKPEEAIQQAVKQAQFKFESVQTFNGNIAGRVGFGGDAKADRQEKLLEKIAGNGDKTNALLEQGGGID